jgi:hypothetical protein
MATLQGVAGFWAVPSPALGFAGAGAEAFIFVSIQPV